MIVYALTITISHYYLQYRLPPGVHVFFKKKNHTIPCSIICIYCCVFEREKTFVNKEIVFYNRNDLAREKRSDVNASECNYVLLNSE